MSPILWIDATSLTKKFLKDRISEKRTLTKKNKDGTFRWDTLRKILQRFN